MASATEGRVERHLDRQVRERLGGITRKWSSLNYVGVPDRIVIVVGEVRFIEVKTTTGKLSPMQEREHTRLRTHGALVHTVYGEAGVDRFIEKMAAGTLSADEEELR